jgi:hypothetical protein
MIVNVHVHVTRAQQREMTFLDNNQLHHHILNKPRKQTDHMSIPKTVSDNLKE